MRPSGLGVTLNVSWPLPWPAVREISVIQLALVVTDQAHSALVVTLSDADPPDASITLGVSASPTAHLTGVGCTSVFDDDPHPATAAMAAARLSPQT
jgi:hypothetical protein